MFFEDPNGSMMRSHQGNCHTLFVDYSSSMFFKDSKDTMERTRVGDHLVLVLEIIVLEIILFFEVVKVRFHFTWKT